MGGATRFLLVLTTPRPPFLRFRLPRLPLSYSSLVSVSLPPPLPPPPPRPRRRGVFLHILKSSSSQEFHSQATTNSVGFEPYYSAPSSPWPEWSRLLERLNNTGYFNRPPLEDAEFVAIHALSQEFIDSAGACLAFARDRPDLLRSLSRRDIDVVVRNGSAFLFKDSPNSVRKMHSFLEDHQSNVLDSDKACTVDLMKFLLSYASDPGVSLDRTITNDKQLLESSVRSLFCQISNTIYSALQSDLSGSVIKQFPDKFGQPIRSSGHNIEMKRGDWVCPGCSFMNFARNVKCLECEEVRPKRQLTGGEWKCPQCDFFNYGKNSVCLRCDCKRPGEVSFSISDVRNVDYTNKVDIDSRLAANEEKAERWFSKISQLDGTTDNSNIADEDFPEIMPLRKGVNRFVVSTRKTPLERRMANNQYQGDFGNDGTSEGDNLQTTTSRSLDDILGRTAVAGTENKSSIAETSDHASRQYGYPRGSSSSYVPFVPLPADTFAKKPQSSQTEGKGTLVTDNHKKSVASEASDPIAPSSWNIQSSMSEESLLLSQKPIQLDNKDKEKEQAEKSERWFKRVAELHDNTDLASAISDEDFPEIMPMRKGENRFVVSKKKDRSLTSPIYKRKMAMEQSTNTNFVPFVPFPPDYFTKKDNQLSDGVVPSKPTDVISGQITSEKLPEKEGYSVPIENQRSTTGNWNCTSSAVKITERNETVTWGDNIGNGTNNFVGPNTTRNNSWTSASSKKEDVSTNFSQQSENPNSNPNPNPNPRDSWTGKSLEGSAVKETDPLDMSEEAKAERWFRRAAQIKDISELSQIPDEDFPSIMPMRKGVNRFVVSKRKTPLERRLTSPQYRRNLPINISEPPFKKEDDTS